MIYLSKDVHIDAFYHIIYCMNDFDCYLYIFSSNLVNVLMIWIIYERFVLIYSKNSTFFWWFRYLLYHLCFVCLLWTCSWWVSAILASCLLCIMGLVAVLYIHAFIHSYILIHTDAFLIHNRPMVIEKRYHVVKYLQYTIQCSVYFNMQTHWYRLVSMKRKRTGNKLRKKMI